MGRQEHGPGDDSGAVAVVAAVFVVAAMLLAAVVVDAGYLYAARRQLQAAADAGALAGCHELILDGGSGDAVAVAKEYAFANAVGPGSGLVVDDVEVDMSAYSVRVSVSRQAPVFFARLIGSETRNVVAVAKATRWQLSGGRYLMPWGLPIIRNVDRVEALVVDGSTVLQTTTLGKISALDYRGSVAAPGAPGGYDVWVRIHNTHGVIERLVDSDGPAAKDTPVARIVTADAAYPFESVVLSGGFIASDAPVLPVLSVRTRQPQPEVKVAIGKVKRQMTDAGGGVLWTYAVRHEDLEFNDDLLLTFPVDVHLGKPDGNDTYIHVRRSTFPVKSVDVAPVVNGAGDGVSVRVLLNEFDPETMTPGQVYTLRVGSQGNEVGNFGEVNYSKIIHHGCPPDPVGVKPGNNYYDWTVSGYPGGVHLGDIVAMSPGGSGSLTYKALSERVSKLAPGEDLVVTIPVVEKCVDKAGGEYDVMVVAFAAFRITEFDKSGYVRGVFLKYLANPSGFEPDPGGSDTSAIYAPRLVNP